MATCQKNHLELTDGVGRCSVPMWCGGMPAGFCDEPAYGEPVPYQAYRSASGEVRRFDGGYSGYVPGLACIAHGGPPAPIAPLVEEESTLDIVFSGPPSHESGRFVEVERGGKSVRAGTWIQGPDDCWTLRLTAADLGTTAA